MYRVKPMNVCLATVNNMAVVVTQPLVRTPNVSRYYYKMITFGQNQQESTQNAG